MFRKSLPTVGGALLLSLALSIAAGSARADVSIYSSPAFVSGSEEETIPLGWYDGTTGWPGGDGLGNTITFGGTDRLLTTVNLGTFDEGTWTLSLYSGTNPNTGTLLGSASVSGGCNDCVSTSGVTFDFTSQDIDLPNTITFVVTGTGNDPGALSGLSPTIGTGVDSMWYGPGLTPTSFVQNNTWVIADAAPLPLTDNYLEAQFNATATPEPAFYGALTLGLIGLFATSRLRKHA